MSRVPRNSNFKKITALLFSVEAFRTMGMSRGIGGNPIKEILPLKK